MVPATIATLALLVGVVWLGNAVARRSSGSTSGNPEETRTRYDDRYQAAFRSDGGTAIVTVDAVYEHPALQAALDAFVQRGFVQSLIHTQLTNLGANDTSLVFAVTFTVPPGFTESGGFSLAGYRPETHATLSDDAGRTYAVHSWTDVVDPSATNSRSGLLSFDRTVDNRTPEQAKATTLRLELTGVPGGTRAFTWNLALLNS